MDVDSESFENHNDDEYFMEARSNIKNLPAYIQGFLAKYKPQQAVVIDEPSPKVRKRCQLAEGQRTE